MRRRSKSAWTVLVTHVVGLLDCLVKEEMVVVVGYLCCTGEDLTEKNLSLVMEEQMVLMLKPVALTLWNILKAASHKSAGEKKQI